MYASLEFLLQKDLTGSGIMTEKKGTTVSTLIPLTQPTTAFQIFSFQDIFDKETFPDGITVADMQLGFETSSGILTTSATIILINTVTKESITIDAKDKGVGYSQTVEVAPGDYTLTYYTNWRQTSLIGNSAYCNVTFKYNISAVYNKLPLKKWTITDCINRCLELVEPLQVTSATGNTTTGTKQLTVQEIETPRFIFDGVTYANGIRQSTYTAGSQAEKYDKVIAPEFAMTKSNLREQLQQIGGFIHAEPRLKIVDGKYIIVFDEYGKREYSPISKKRHITKVLKQSVNDFCTELDSTVDNLVNRLSYAKGAVVEPYNFGGKSLRAETTAMRINDSSAYIPTYLPIDDIVKLEIKAPTSADNSSWTDYINITDYVFEKADYDNMSSYDKTYPYSKAFALYYTQGEKGVQGLFFKNPDVVSQAWFQNYAIINILQACGANVDTSDNYRYPIISFRITYIPRYSARVRTSKQLIIPGLPSTLAYNQGANLVETRYYGENLKGVVARLGNVEKTLTYKVGYLTDIPKAGQLFDKNYYISAVEWEIFSSYFKVTIGLSKDFNRLSEYVGISSVNRMYQVSEKQAQARDSVFNEYLLITENKEAKSNASLATLYIPFVLSEWFKSDSQFTFNPRPDFCEVWGLTKGGQRVRDYDVVLPVCISEMGNSIAFSVNFQDNYSAGQKSTRVQIEAASTYWSDYVPYNDYYGRFYYLNFEISMLQNAEELVGERLERTLPQAKIWTEIPGISEVTRAPIITTARDAKEYPIVYRKESTEAPSLTYQLSIVTDNDAIIIGSGFARNMPFINTEIGVGDNGVTYKPIEVKIYILEESIALFADKIDIDGLVGISITTDYNVQDVNNNTELSFNPVTANKSGKAWAIVTNSRIVSHTVEDEDGKTVVQTEQRGCDLIFGKNEEVTDGQTIELPRLVLKRKLY